MPQPPSIVPGLGEGGHAPGVGGSSNNSWPIWGGTGLEPGTGVKFDIDGTEYFANVDENGTWEFTPPEALANGDHEYEMWSFNPTTGEESDRIEWESHVDADATARELDAERVEEWKEGGADRFRDANRPQTGTGGTPPQPRGGGFEKGSPGTAVAVGVPTSSPQGLEKGNQAPDASQ
jgi:hypothetical protein